MESVTIPGIMLHAIGDGVRDTPALIRDGAYCGRSVLAAAGIFAVHVMLIRLASAADDSCFAAAVERANACMRDGSEHRLPAPHLSAFLAPAAGPATPRWVTLPPTEVWTLDEGRYADPTCRHQREALEFIRALFAESLRAATAG